MFIDAAYQFFLLKFSFECIDRRDTFGSVDSTHFGESVFLRDNLFSNDLISFVDLVISNTKLPKQMLTSTDH